MFLISISQRREELKKQMQAYDAQKEAKKISETQVYFSSSTIGFSKRVNLMDDVLQEETKKLDDMSVRYVLCNATNAATQKKSSYQ